MTSTDKDRPGERSSATPFEIAVLDSVSQELDPPKRYYCWMEELRDAV
jgi:hypothetical protein